MTIRQYSILFFLSLSLLLSRVDVWSKEALPIEPDVSTRLDELYDHEARLFLMLYSLKGDGKFDYIGATVQ